MVGHELGTSGPGDGGGVAPVVVHPALQLAVPPGGADADGWRSGRRASSSMASKPTSSMARTSSEKVSAATDVAAQPTDVER